MAQTVLITLTLAGSDTGPFSLYSNIDGYAVAFETNIPRLALEVGYLCSIVPDSADTIRVQSDNPICDNYVDLTIVSSTTTTSSTSTTSTSTSTTSTTTTTPATIEFDAFSCRNAGSCDGTPGTCSVVGAIVVGNYPVGSYVELNIISGGTVTLLSSDPGSAGIEVTFASISETTQFDILLKNAGGITIASQLGLLVAYNSYPTTPFSTWAELPLC